MLAGKPASETEELIYVIREICPNIGFIERSGEIILTGNDIRHLEDVLDVLKRIDRIVAVNEYGTMASLETKDENVTVTDIQDGNRGEIVCAIA